MSLSDDQQEAMSRVEAWLKTDQQVFAMGGSAGTGKTTLINPIRRQLCVGRRTAVAAYTNRAAMVLCSKGLRDAQTIHQLMYDMVSRDPMRFARRSQLPYDLVIIDESSMIGETINRDLTSFGKKVLYVGDPFQIGPVNDGESVITNPDYCLTTPHRFDDRSIEAKANLIREGKSIHGVPKAQADLSAYDIILCFSNNKRNWLNARIRGKSRPARISDKIVACRNFYDYGVYNGEVGTILDLPTKNSAIVDFGRGPVKFPMFCMLEPGENPHDKMFNMAQVCDWGWALTVHRAQGSQWPRVLTWYEPGMDRRLLYTAITRGSRVSEVAV